MAYVSEYGNWGVEEILTFDADKLTEHQWHILDELADYDKLPYVWTILRGDDVSEWEAPYS